MLLDWNVLLAFAFGLLILYLLARILYFPLKWLARLIGNAIIGGIILYIFNFIGGFWGLNIGINVITALIVGILGIPGVVLLLVLQWIFG